MRALDFSPLMRSAVGFDGLLGMADQLTRNGGDNGYPPYDILRTSEDDYRITMALAGFSDDDLNVVLEDDMLLIEGKAEDAEKADQGAGEVANEADETTWLHRGIARRAFSRRFRLAENIRVTGASFENGLLNVQLVREVPEHQKPRQIAINSTATAIEGDKAA